MIRNAHISDIDTIARFQVAMALETENMELDIETVTKGVQAFIKVCTST